MAMTALTALGLGLSLCAQLVAAYLFGASGAMDAYFAGVALPMALVLLANEVASLLIVPRLHETRRLHGEAALAGLQGRLLLVNAALWTAVAGACIAGREGLIGMLFGGFGAAAARDAAQVLAVQFLAVPLSTSASLLMHFRFLQGGYALPYAAMIGAPLFVIASAGALHGPLGPLSLALGSVAGAACQCVVLFVLGRGWRLRIGMAPSLDLLWGAKLALPVLLAVAPVHAAALIDRHFAAAMDEGSLTALSYSWFFTMAAVAVVFRGWSLPVFHAMAGDALEEAALLRERILKSTRELLLLAGAMFLALQLAGPLVIGWVLARGAFDAAAAGVVEATFRFHSGAIPGLVLFMLFVRACCAMRRHRAACALGLLGLAGYATLASALQAGGAPGLAQASLLTWSTLGFGALLYMRRAWLSWRPSASWAR